MPKYAKLLEIKNNNSHLALGPASLSCSRKFFIVIWIMQVQTAGILLWHIFLTLPYKYNNINKLHNQFCNLFTNISGRCCCCCFRLGCFFNHHQNTKKFLWNFQNYKNKLHKISLFVSLLAGAALTRCWLCAQNASSL